MAEVAPMGTPQMEVPPTPPKFVNSEIIVHKATKGEYMILHTPPRTFLESGKVPAYVYADMPNLETVWVRSQTEMEDGRFVKKGQ